MALSVVLRRLAWALAFAAVALCVALALRPVRVHSDVGLLHCGSIAFPRLHPEAGAEHGCGDALSSARGLSLAVALLAGGALAAGAAVAAVVSAAVRRSAQSINSI